MQVFGLNTRTNQVRALLLGALLASVVAFLPTGAQAASTGWWPKWGGGGSALPGFWVTGEVVEIAADSVTVQLPNERHAHGMMRYVNLQVTFDVDEQSVLLDDAFGGLALSTLVEGDEVVVVPGLVWGNLVARLLYAGEPDELADASYRGKFVEAEGDVLTLRHGRNGEFAVLVDEATIWYDNGQMARPTELAEDLTLRVLGVEAENEDGEDVVRAVLITPGN